MAKKQNAPKPGRMFYNLTLLITAAVFVCVFVYMMLFCMFFSRTEQSSYDKNLTEFPEFTLSSFFSGEFTSNLSKYFTDTVHNRDTFKENASKIKAYYGIEQEEEHFITPGGTSTEDNSKPDVSEPTSSAVTSEEESRYEESEPLEESSEAEISEEVSEEEPFEEEVLKDIVILGSGSKTRAMEVFYYSESASKTYAERINSFAAKLPGINVYSMVIPKQCAYYIKNSKDYGYTADHSLKADTTIKQNLNGVIYVDAYHALEKHVSEEIYARTDHHWTALGAYYAAEEFARTAGVSFMPMSEYELNRRPGYVGTMYSFAPSAKILNNPEDFLTLVPKVEHKADFYDKNYKFVTEHDIFWYINDSMKSGWYSTFLGNDDYMVRIKSPVCKNGRKLFMIKDSYGNALSPLFLGSFEEIYIADLRYMNVNAVDFINERGITDVLFAICSYSAVNGNINKRIDAITKIGK